MGNFSINHYARFDAQPQILNLRYVIDYAEIPTSERRTQLDTNGDNTVSEPEQKSFLQTEAASLVQGLSVSFNSQPAALKINNSRVVLRPGAGGLNTMRVMLDFQIPLPSQVKTRVEYRDANYEGRTGWMEIIAVGTASQKIQNSTAASADRSRELTVFPTDASAVPPRQNAAVFTVVQSAKGPFDISDKKSGASTLPQSVNEGISNSDTTPSASGTPANRFTQAIAERELTPALMLMGVLFALGFGAVHALSPGHGKTMVAAYLVGSRGTPRHAVLLGAVVTITHTFGVFLLGIITLFATRYIVPEKLYPALSGASGLLIFGVGIWLFMDRWQIMQVHGHHEAHYHGHHHAHSHDYADDDYQEYRDEHGNMVHSHGGKTHSHAIPDGPVTAKTLVLLGISGGIVPCPEALVVLLAAIKMQRIFYGLLLIVSFSIGLAAALISIGLIVVSARQRLRKTGNLAGGDHLMRFLPIGSAVIITIIGAMMTMTAMGSGQP